MTIKDNLAKLDKQMAARQKAERVDPLSRSCRMYAVLSNVVAPSESHATDPPTIGWSILNRKTGLWSDYWAQCTQSETLEGIGPFTQYWKTVCVVLVGSDFFISGYSDKDALDTFQPCRSMRLLKFTRQ